MTLGKLLCTLNPSAPHSKTETHGDLTGLLWGWKEAPPRKLNHQWLRIALLIRSGIHFPSRPGPGPLHRIPLLMGDHFPLGLCFLYYLKDKKVALILYSGKALIINVVLNAHSSFKSLFPINSFLIVYHLYDCSALRIATRFFKVLELLVLGPNVYKVKYVWG